jgi:hypothetical protein
VGKRDLRCQLFPEGWERRLDLPVHPERVGLAGESRLIALRRSFAAMQSISGKPSRPHWIAADDPLSFRRTVPRPAGAARPVTPASTHPERSYFWAITP